MSFMAALSAMKGQTHPQTHAKHPWPSMDGFSVLTLLTSSFVGGSFGVISYYFEDYADHVGRDWEDINFVFISLTIGSCIGSGVGPLFDFFPSQVLLIYCASLCLLAGSVTWLSFIYTYVWLCVGFGFCGLAMAMVFSGFQVLTVWHHLEESGPFLSLNFCTIAIGALLVPVGIYSLSAFSTLWQLMGAYFFPCVACGLAVLLFNPSDNLHPELAMKASEEQLRPLLRSSHGPNHLSSTLYMQSALFFVGFCVSASQSTFNTYIKSYAQGYLNMSSSESSLLLIAFFAGFVVGTLLGSILLVNRHPSTILNFGVGIYVLTAGIPLVDLSSSSCLWASSCLYGIACGPLFGATFEQSREWVGGSGEALYPLSLSMNVGGNLGPFIAGKLIDSYSYPAFVWTVFIFAVLFLLGNLVLGRIHATFAR